MRNLVVPVPAPAILVILLLGFAYSGLATLRLFRELFAAPPVSGPTSTIDAYIVPLGLASGDRLREAVHRAEWESDAEVAFVVDPSVVSAEQRSQLYMAASYLLYPARVLLKSPDKVLATPSHGRARRVIVVGYSNLFPDASVEKVSGVLRLVSLP